MKLVNVLRIPKKSWMRIGVKIKGWTYKDAMSGIVQGKQRRYKSKAYKEYKSRGMRRKTDGELLKSMKNRNPRSTWTKQVNMMLTGRLFRGLKPIKSTTKSVTMSFNESDSGKVEGALDNGTDILTLNPKRQRNVRTEIINEFDKLIKKYCKKPIIIKA